MSKMVWIQLWFKSKEEVIIKRKRWGWPVKWDISYYDYASTRSNRNRCESELVSAIQKVRKIVRSLVEADEAHKGDLESAADSNGGNRFGVSRPVNILIKSLKDYDTYHGKPDEEVWREALNPMWLAKLGLGKKVKKKSTSGDAPPSRGNRTSFTTADSQTVSEHRFEFGGDDGDVETFEVKKGNSTDKGAMKEWKKQWRQDNPFDGEEHGSNAAYEKAVQKAWIDFCD